MGAVEGCLAKHALSTVTGWCVPTLLCSVHARMCVDAAVQAAELWRHCFLWALVGLWRQDAR